MLRFSFFSDTFIEMDGWYIDDVGVIVDWFESTGSWTSDLISENSHSFAPTIDIDASVPDGAGGPHELPPLPQAHRGLVQPELPSGGPGRLWVRRRTR